MTVLYVLSLCFVVMIVIGAITLNPITPICHVNDVRVKNFNTKPTLTGDWYTNITVYNPNRGRFGHFHEFILYFMHNNDVLAGSTMPGFNIDKNKHELVEVNASTRSENVMALKNPELKCEALQKERDNLFVVVDLKIVPVTVFVPKIGLYEERKAMAFCPGMKIKFQKDTEGRLDKSDGQPNFCRIMIL
ncbi:putative Late embryogenesis abundant protein, LEA-14 [Lupinus albus]|uniref:Putative Late embryogenesis abundant protein, LEA-14 n=1 Tax=Lupinus albus TaxID=3870 RepID=A0A6A4MWK9_LUPAL|nr:putative Late embryogenesis abundant protein, LEA-14 [Lupinus albus]